MTVHLSILVALPLAGSLAGAAAGRHSVRWWSLGGSALALAYAIVAVVRFKSGGGLQFVTDETWIEPLGVHWKLGADGLNLLLVLLTSVLFTASTLWSALSGAGRERPGLYYFWLGAAHAAVLGALLAQDLLLFVLFFDLMLVPFFFLTGMFGGPDRIPAILKLFIYTLVGSLLMLAAAIATAALSKGDSSLSFVLSDLAERGGLSSGSQDWIFLCFAAAFLVKMPAFPLHGWMPDGYSAMPLPVLAVFSGVLSKVAAYGFLKIALPLFPEGAERFQMLILLIGLTSILYGSAMAFTTTSTRLILGYSSIAQLGFIVLGIFSLRPDGAQGALLQALNHGIVVAPAFFIVALLAARAEGSEDIRRMGGLAFRAPVLATLFLVVALANLAMPGSSNFAGEFMILLGVFEEKAAIAVVAFTGVALASVYTLRLFIRSMHNRESQPGSSREMTFADGLVLVPLVLCIVALALCPQVALDRSERSVTAAIEATTQPARAEAPMTGVIAQSAGQAPHIDWAGLSPLVALLGGAIVVLVCGLLRSRFAREVAVPLLAIAVLLAAGGLSIWQWDAHEDLISGALRADELTAAMTLVFCVAGVATVLLSWRAVAPREAAHGEYYALLLTAAAGMAVLVGAQNTITLFLGYELLSIPLYVLCATEMRRASSLESGLKYLIVGSVGSATLLYGLAMLYGATGSTDFGGIAGALGEGDLVHDPLLLTGIALTLVGIAFKGSVAPFHQWTPDVYEGAPTPVTAFMAVATKAAAIGVALRLFDVALLEARADWAPILAALAAITIVVGNVGALGQSSLKRLLAYSSIAQAGYMLGGIVVATRIGLEAAVFYIVVYLLMNLAAFAVIVARERETPLGDDIAAMEGIGAQRPLLAWPMTIAMLSLAGIPATAGFIGKVYLIDALVDGGYTWLGVVIVVGSMISLAYYLRVVAAIWMRPVPAAAAAVAGAALDAPPGERPAKRVAGPEVVAVAVVGAAATLFFGVIPSPLLELAQDVGRALGLG